MHCSQFVFVALVLTVHTVFSETFHEILDSCNKEIGFHEDVEKMNFNDPAFPKDAKCVLACVLEKKGVFKADGSIDKEKEKAIPEEIIKDEGLKQKYMKAIDECDGSAKANKCETAHEFMKCVKAAII